jgi:hypothetical protein
MDATSEAERTTTARSTNMGASLGQLVNSARQRKDIVTWLTVPVNVQTTLLERGAATDYTM